MTDSLQFSSRDRVLVFAPHPDDETIATGELIQAVREAGAELRIVFATDGENNPWPQRWLERRWRIGPAERARWGRRRRREGITALTVLGVEGGHAHFLGWPDQGLTALLMHDDCAVGILAKEISAFEPTHVALPTLADRHPDHGALRVMLDLALLRTSGACMRLGYTVHGAFSDGLRRVLPGDSRRRERKRGAMQAHLTQIALSGTRLLRLAARPETFEVVAHPLPGHRAPTHIRLPHRSGWWRRRRSDLLLLLTTRDGTTRYRCPLPRMPPRGVPSMLSATDGRALQVTWEEGALSITLPETLAPLTAVHAKFDRAGKRLVIFDHERWLGGESLFNERIASDQGDMSAQAG